MKVISFETIKNLQITPKQCFEWVSTVIAHKEEALLPPKISMKPGLEGVFYNVMPSIIPQEQCGGVKLVTRYPKRNPSLDSQILLYDLQSGENLALLDGNWITTMRTGAVAAYSIHLLAKKDFSKLGFIGLGNTARATLEVLLAVYPEKQFEIRLKEYKDQHLLFAERFKAHSNLRFEFCNNYENLISASDVVISAATVFENDICEDQYYPEGILLVPIHTRGFTNCDLFFDKVFADDVSHVKGFRNFNQFKYFAEVSEVVNGRKAGRQDDHERILAYNIGIAVHDMFFASQIYKKIGQNCPEISLQAPTEKFWI